MQGGEKLSLDKIRELMSASEELRFTGHSREDIYKWVETTMGEHGYGKQGRAVKGLLRSYIAKMTGLSRAQVTRLIAQHVSTGEVKPTVYRRRRFPSRYTRRDAELLAMVDEAHETLSGPATRAILNREYNGYGNKEFARLACISVAQLYRMRKSRPYRNRRITFHGTKAGKAVAIGERRKPEPEGQPGYLRIDTVHQGDKDGVKGVYHINAVDEVTQWQVMACVPQISEAWLAPALIGILQDFPFRIRGFHSDNGSEYINHTVAKLLDKLRIEQTKSRPRRSNDNGLVEAKNGWVVRKHMGYTHIAADHAEAVQRFYSEHLNNYVNFHRPSGQAEMISDKKGKQRRVYRKFQTPWEVFRQLPGACKYLKSGQTLRALDQFAKSESDTSAARRMQEAKLKLFRDVEAARRTA